MPHGCIACPNGQGRCCICEGHQHGLYGPSGLPAPVDVAGLISSEFAPGTPLRVDENGLLTDGADRLGPIVGVAGTTGPLYRSDSRSGIFVEQDHVDVRGLEIRAVSEDENDHRTSVTLTASEINVAHTVGRPIDLGPEPPVGTGQIVYTREIDGEHHLFVFLDGEEIELTRLRSTRAIPKPGSEPVEPPAEPVPTYWDQLTDFEND